MIEDLPYQSLYQQLKNSLLVPYELRVILPNKILGDASGYRSEISVKDGNRWVSVKFHNVSDEDERVIMIDDLCDKYSCYKTAAIIEVIISDKTRVIVFADVPHGYSVEYYSSYRVK